MDLNCLNQSRIKMEHSLEGKRIWVAGHSGMVGGAVCRRLERENCEIIIADREKVNLVNQEAVNCWMRESKPDIVVLAAAKVGGINANNLYPVEFLYENIMIEANVVSAAHEFDVSRLLFLGSSCIYPKLTKQPIEEDSLLSGKLEPTNEWYAIAKIAGIKLVQAYRKQHKRDWISAMPTNLYGPGDQYDLQNSHVIPALLRKFHEAKENGHDEVLLWGTGSPLREFMHCDDLADALIYLLKHYSEDDHINVGSGEEHSIQDLAKIVAKVVGCSASIVWDHSKPDGTPRKLMDSSKLNSLGWRNTRSLFEGLSQTYDEFSKLD